MNDLKRKYFEQYDKLPKDIADLAKANWSESFSKKNPIFIESPSYAIFFGFNWDFAEPNFNYWNNLYNDLILKRKIE